MTHAYINSCICYLLYIGYPLSTCYFPIWSSMEDGDFFQLRTRNTLFFDKQHSIRKEEWSLGLLKFQCHFWVRGQFALRCIFHFFLNADNFEIKHKTCWFLVKSACLIWHVYEHLKLSDYRDFRVMQDWSLFWFTI